MIHPIKHFKTITKHRHVVIVHCFKAGVFWQGLRHDLSKYSPTEFIPGMKYYAGTHSPNETERAEFGYSLAWIHHKGRNKHHFEYWTDYNPKSKVVEPVSPGIDTRMLFEGTLRLLVSFWLHDVMMPTKASIATM